jgi:hypothetical protein
MAQPIAPTAVEIGLANNILHHDDHQRAPDQYFYQRKCHFRRRPTATQTTSRQIYAHLPAFCPAIALSLAWYIAISHPSCPPQRQPASGRGILEKQPILPEGEVIIARPLLDASPCDFGVFASRRTGLSVTKWHSPRRQSGHLKLAGNVQRTRRGWSADRYHVLRKGLFRKLFLGPAMIGYRQLLSRSSASHAR